MQRPDLTQKETEILNNPRAVKNPEPFVPFVATPVEKPTIKKGVNLTKESEDFNKPVESYLSVELDKKIDTQAKAKAKFESRNQQTHSI